MVAIESLGPMPEELSRALAGSALEELSVGCSGARLLRAVRPKLLPMYLKIATGALRNELAGERDRLLWLHGRLPVPEVVATADDGIGLYLLLSEVPGLMSCDARFVDDVPHVVRALAAGLRHIHALDWKGCPFDERTAAKLATAQCRLAAGLVDEEDMDAFARELGPEKLLRWLSEHIPATEDLVFTHGDYCLPNVLLDPENMHVSGFIDWGRAGVADRYQDLALAARSLTYNFGERWVQLLREAYGLDSLSEEKIEYFTLLDELY